MGILVSDTAKPLVERNTLKGHVRPAIAILGESSGIVRDNCLCKNECVGIDVRGSSRPAIQGNTVEGNGGIGILIRDHSCPVSMERNSFSSLKSSPITVTSPMATPLMKGNVLDGVALE